MEEHNLPVTRRRRQGLIQPGDDHLGEVRLVVIAVHRHEAHPRPVEPVILLQHLGPGGVGRQHEVVGHLAARLVAVLVIPGRRIEGYHRQQVGIRHIELARAAFRPPARVDQVAGVQHQVGPVLADSPSHRELMPVADPGVAQGRKAEPGLALGGRTGHRRGEQPPAAANLVLVHPVRFESAHQGHLESALDRGDHLPPVRGTLPAHVQHRWLAGVQAPDHAEAIGSHALEHRAGDQDRLAGIVQGRPGARDGDPHRPHHQRSYSKSPDRHGPHDRLGTQGGQTDRPTRALL